MRGSGWAIFILALLIFAVVIILPTSFSIIEITTGETSDQLIYNQWQLLLSTSCWAIAIAIGAVIAGWYPGRLLAGLLHKRGFIPASVMCILPICLPPYALYWVYQLAWPVDSSLYKWAASEGHLDILRMITLFLALVSWAWPIVAISVAGALSSFPRDQEDMLLLEGATLLQRLSAIVRTGISGIAVGGIIVFLFIFNNTTAFDIAQVKTLGFELRSVEAGGGTPRDVLAYSWPSIIIAVVCVIAVSLIIKGQKELISTRTSRVGKHIWIIAPVILAATLTVPVWLMFTPEISAESIKIVRAGYERAAINTFISSGITGFIACIVAIGIASAWSDRRSWVRWLAHIQAIGWILAATVPAMVVTVVLIVTLNRPLLDFIYDSPAITVIAGLTRFGFVGVLFGGWIAWREAKEIRALRELDGAQTVKGQWETNWPRWLAAGIATWAVVAVLSVGEVIVTGRLQPPGFETIARILLDNMHYQHDELALLMMAILFILALLVSAVVSIAWWLWGRNITTTTPLFLILLLLPLAYISGCSDESSTATLNPELVFGTPGRSLGQFVYPRAIDVDEKNEYIFVVDRSGRIQRFSLNGDPQKSWELPEYDNGYPTGISVADDGRIFIANTHEHCVTIMDAEGNLLDQFGEFGDEPGQFIFPTDVEFGPSGTIYVSQYGDGKNDCIQVFDSGYNYLFRFGEFGTKPGQFRRPQSMSFNPEMTELYVADAINNRIQVFDPKGVLLRMFGGTGTEPGQYRYLYGVKLLSTDSVLICEFGNSRLQLVSKTGEPIKVLGRLGSGPGELTAPWGVAEADGRLFVLDSRNSRVQIIKTP